MTSPYKSGSLTTKVREIARYKLHLVDVREVRWDKGGNARLHFSMEKEMDRWRVIVNAVMNLRVS